jgi:hypothetical protein
MSNALFFCTGIKHQACNLTPVCNADEEADAGEIFLVWQSCLTCRIADDDVAKPGNKIHV